jgi:hypothetical protein
MNQSQLWALAYHEAAHAVIAEASGIRVDGMSIIGSDVDTGLCTAPAKGHVLITRVCASDFEVACFFASGPVAEELFATGKLRSSAAPGSDLDQVEWFTCGDPEVMEFVVVETRKLVLRHQSTIERVASTLLDKRMLSGSDVRAAL